MRPVDVPGASSRYHGGVMPRVTLRAPLSGIVVPLDEVPDPVFAQRLVGDGVAIAPTSSTVLAPCAGRVAHVHEACHAITISTSDGLEVMVHVGLDTVKLHGLGFTATVSVGDEVAEGQELLEFDAEFVSQRSRTLLTQIVVTNSDRVAALHPILGEVVAGRDAIADVDIGSAGPATADDSDERAEATGLPIVFDDGLHARPAAAIVRAMEALAADVTVARVDGRVANARSVIALMALDLARGDEVTVRATGPAAQRALQAVQTILASGEARTTPQERPTPPPPAFSSAPRFAFSASPGSFRGVVASPGLAIGRVHQVRRGASTAQDEIGEATAGHRPLDAALGQARAQLRALAGRAANAGAVGATIVSAQEALLDDPELVGMAREAIAGGASPARAWSQAVDAQAARVSRLTQRALSARAYDIRDVGRRVLRLLTGAPSMRFEVPPRSVLVADEFTPTDMLSLDRSRVVGVCSVSGGETSHAAILARAFELPALVGTDAKVLELPDGAPVVLHATEGVLVAYPTDKQLGDARVQQRASAEVRAAARANAEAPAQTSDGRRVAVVANVGGVAEAGQVVSLGGEGVGLLRTEFVFLDRADAPSEDEQAEIYAVFARLLGPDRRLVIRTLDVGGDKPLPYMPLPHAATPFLGERGIRVQLDRPTLLRTQLRAILRASTTGRIAVMFPMVATVDEWRAAKALLDEERERLGVAPVPTGIMVEVPSAAVMASVFAREVDFFSIGTNDLAQYTLAMDRGHSTLTSHADGLHPAVIQLIAQTVEAAHAFNRRVTVCGDLAGDLEAIPILVGLGVDELSVGVPSLPAVKAHVRTLSARRCTELARQARLAESAAAVRGLVRDQG